MYIRKLNNSHGFTLIEIMVATTILAILAAIAVPAYNSYVRTGRLQECVNEVAAIRLAEEEFRMERNTYFVGIDIPALELASLGYYQSTFAAPAAANCRINVIAGAAGIANSYTVTSIGQNELDASDTIILGN